MIEIIEQGDLNRLKGTLRFACKACGCLFNADREDYTWEYSPREDCGWWSIKCPCCKQYVTRKDD